MNKLAVVAFGGNALLRGDQKGTIDEQEANAYITSNQLLTLIKKDYDLVITHGNGPQVGNILLANSAGAKLHGLPDMPIDVSVAYSQGFIGYVIEQQLRNVLNVNNINRDIITVVTQVLVDKDDPAFKNPTKPVGPFYSSEEAERIASETNSVFKADPRGRGFRKVVASPQPLSVFNIKTIEKLARAHEIVIAVGGGGIPVYEVDENKFQGTDAVIDKDLASALLAVGINADEFYILTDVSKACLFYNTPQQVSIDRMSVKEAMQYIEEGHFADGSMGPKVKAAVYFTTQTGKDSLITSAEMLGSDNEGTRITIS
ncbi:MAG: carbamate kinase [Bacteroidales bacterium]